MVREDTIPVGPAALPARPMEHGRLAFKKRVSTTAGRADTAVRPYRCGEGWQHQFGE